MHYMSHHRSHASLRKASLSLLILLCLAAFQVSLPPCGDQRPTTLSQPWAGADKLYCLERVIQAGAVGAVGYFQATLADDGSLYAVVPYRGEVHHLLDTDADGLPDTARTVLDNLPFPTAITHHNGQLWLGAGESLYRYDIADATLTPLIEPSPHRLTGGIISGLVVGADERLYAVMNADRECSSTTSTLTSFDLDGTNRQSVIGGLDYGADLALVGNDLWVAQPEHDQILQVEIVPPHAEPCPPLLQAENTATYHFPAGSAPTALAFYPHDTFPNLHQRLLVGLRGNTGEVVIQGYSVVALDLAHADGQPLEAVLPRNSPHLGISDQKMTIQGSGIYPHHVYDVVVSAQGWVYVVVGGGNIYALRPY